MFNTISIFTRATAALAWLTVSTGAMAQLPAACGEVAVEEAMADFELGSHRTNNISQLFDKQDAAVAAAMRQCRKGATIAVPARYVSGYCDMNKSTAQVPGKTVCVKR